MIEPLRPDVISPPAIVQAAFDEARAIAEIKAAVERRDEAKGEFKSATLAIGQRLLDARRAMPDVPNARGGAPLYSPAFLAFAEKTGLSRQAIRQYMSYARNPARIERNNKKTVLSRRRKLLEEVRALLAEAPDLDTARRVIAEELRELTA